MKRDKNMPYSDDELYAPYEAPVYRKECREEIAFPIGGIGSGTISLSGRGELVDWEIFNRPNKNYRPRHTFFSIWAHQAGREPMFRVLEARLPASYSRHLTELGGTGTAPAIECDAGLLRMQDSEFIGEFPFGTVKFIEPHLPVNVTLAAFNPFIPLNEDDSSLPAAIFYLNISNPTQSAVSATVAMNLENMIGYTPTGGMSIFKAQTGRCINTFRKSGDINGIFLHSEKYSGDSPRFGNLALGVLCDDVTYQAPWLRGGWWDGLQHFCNTFVQTGMFDNNNDSSPSDDGRNDIVSLGATIRLQPGQHVTIPFILAWYFPLFERYWDEWFLEECPSCSTETPTPIVWKNHYATRFSDAWDVLKYTSQNLERLYQETHAFSNTLRSSTVPGYVIDAVTANISILKTPTCVRLTDGSFYGFEGCCGRDGCCVGTCTHVWNYAQALPYLFPRLERSVRENEFRYSVRESDGHMRFRMKLPLDTKGGHTFHAAVDGQLGGILKLYREWLICGDDEWLREMWKTARKTLEYAWVAWDADKDGIIDGLHHNTYDIEFHGAEPLANSFYLAALKAAEKIASHLGETDNAEEYARIYASGSQRMDELLFNGEYYVQQIDNIDQHKYQYGAGCLSDQLIGQWYADMLGLGLLLEDEHVLLSLESIFRYNWVTTLGDFNNPQRVFAMNDEKGLLLCAWPHGGRPRFPLVYADEVWSGIEYQVASCMLYHGMLKEGLSIVRGVRERHQGNNRNPWNEVECGNHYARAMASYSLLLALSGFWYSASARSIVFDPRINQHNFKCFFSVDSAWGMYEQILSGNSSRIKVDVFSGNLELHRLSVGFRVKPEAGIFCTAGDIEQITDKETDEAHTHFQFHSGIVIKPGAPLLLIIR